MTLPIPPARVKLYRAMWNRWIIVLRVLFDLGAERNPIHLQAVTDTLGIDRGTSEKYINSLKREGYITEVVHGYILTHSGMQELLASEEAVSSYSVKKWENLSPLVVEEVNDSESVKLTSSTSTEVGEILPKNHDPNVVRIFEKIEILFDDANIENDKLPYYLHEDVVLGWVAYCYDRRERLSSPCGLIFYKLISNQRPRPPAKYMKFPEKFLPEEYLDAIGRYKKVCGKCSEPFSSLSEFRTHWESCLRTHVEESDDDQPVEITADETVQKIVSGNLTAEQIWQAVLDALQKEMPEVSFKTWVRDTKAIHCESGLLTIGTRNSYTQSWLEDRLSTRVKQMLNEYRADLRVKFVVAMETEA